MDIVLEGFDTFLFDPLYALVFPARPELQAFPSSSANATRLAAKVIPSTQWTYQPSTKYFSLTPGKYAYMSALPRDNIYRQALTLYLITWCFGLVVYFVCASLSYYFIFDKKTFNHPRYLKNQIRMEIRQTMESLPVMAIFTTPFFLAEVRGYGRLYDSFADAPFVWYNPLQFPFFLLFTDFWIYWIHRGLHHPLIYKTFHKPHHKWIMPTPYASHAFHPVDGFSQSLPYHIFAFVFPLQKFAYVALFIFINVWTVLIHDGEYVATSTIINGAACHTGHHLSFSINYGQYTTLWDRIGGTYRPPSAELFNKETKMSKKLWDKQTKEMDEIVKRVEGDDDRTYGAEERKKNR
ncbi:MAG: c-5 sterol desaturase [Vezdaea aestivalis]|nr:MAG: c-5 sterol desaturase [Vezdaea aestivalis]